MITKTTRLLLLATTNKNPCFFFLPCHSMSAYPLMSDGRLFTSWKQDATINEHLRTTHHIQSNWEYRQFLQTRGQELQESNRALAIYEVGMQPWYTSVPAPGYDASDIKEMYLTREQHQARLRAPTFEHKSKR